MNTFTADATLQKLLSLLTGLTEVRDTTGTVLGYFSPASRRRADAYAEAAALFDPAEMQRRKVSGDDGSTTGVVLSRISALSE